MRLTDSQIALTHLSVRSERSRACPELEFLERLSAGRVHGAEKRQLHEHLGECTPCYRAFCDARDALASGGGAAPPPTTSVLETAPAKQPKSKQRPGFTPFVPFALAASLVMAIFIAEPGPPESTSLEKLDLGELSHAIGLVSSDAVPHAKSGGWTKAVASATERLRRQAYVSGYYDQRDAIQNEAFGGSPRVEQLREQCGSDVVTGHSHDTATLCQKSVDEGASRGAALARVQASCASTGAPGTLNSGRMSQIGDLKNFEMEDVALCDDTSDPCVCADRLLAGENWPGFIASNTP